MGGGEGGVAKHWNVAGRGICHLWLPCCWCIISRPGERSVGDGMDVIMYCCWCIISRPGDGMDVIMYCCWCIISRPGDGMDVIRDEDDSMNRTLTDSTSRLVSHYSPHVGMQLVGGYCGSVIVIALSVFGIVNLIAVTFNMY